MMRHILVDQVSFGFGNIATINLSRFPDNHENGFNDCKTFCIHHVVLQLIRSKGEKYIS